MSSSTDTSPHFIKVSLGKLINFSWLKGEIHHKINFDAKLICPLMIWSRNTCQSQHTNLPQISVPSHGVSTHHTQTQFTDSQLSQRCDVASKLPRKLWLKYTFSIYTFSIFQHWEWGIHSAKPYVWFSLYPPAHMTNNTAHTWTSNVPAMRLSLWACACVWCFYWLGHSTTLCLSSATVYRARHNAPTVWPQSHTVMTAQHPNDHN